MRWKTVEEDAARERLAHWQQVDAGALPRSEIVRHVIEYSVLSAHRHVFGVLAWFSVLAALGLGPTGAVLYRMAEFVSRYWHHRHETLHRRPAKRCSLPRPRPGPLIDWLPARLTALSFAVVGSFEEAIEGWRFHAQRFPNDNDGVVLAATAGAINVRLGGEALKARSPPRCSHGLRDGCRHWRQRQHARREPEVGHLRSVVGLVWRSVVVWMLLLALLTLATPAGVRSGRQLGLARLPRASASFLVARLAQFSKHRYKFCSAVALIPPALGGIFECIQHAAARLVQVGAVVEAAVAGMGGNVGHAGDASCMGAMWCRPNS
jgi:membrane protein required for beta-lactamase induction